MVAACGAVGLSGAARGECVFDNKGNLIRKDLVGRSAAVQCGPASLPDSFKVDVLDAAGQPALMRSTAHSFRIEAFVELTDPESPPLILRSRPFQVVVTDSKGDEVDPGNAKKGLYTARAYEVVDATEAGARIKEAKKSVEPTAEHLESLRQCWADWSTGLSGACDAAGLQTLHTKLLMDQRKHCTRPIGIEPKAKCAWYVRALELTAEALKPGGTNNSLAPHAQCAALDALFQKSGANTCASAADVLAIRAMDKLIEDPSTVPSGSYDLLVSKTEFFTGLNEDKYFRTVDYEESKVLVNPSEGADSYVAITNFPHDLDAVIEWKAEREDPSASLRNAAGFVGFLIASYARQPASLPTLSVGSSSGQVTMVPPKEVVLGPPAAHKGMPAAQALLDLLPPRNEAGTRFIGPIRPQKDTKYRLSVVEREIGRAHV